MALSNNKGFAMWKKAEPETAPLPGIGMVIAVGSGLWPEMGLEATISLRSRSIEPSAQPSDSSDLAQR